MSVDIEALAASAVAAMPDLDIANFIRRLRHLPPTAVVSAREIRLARREFIAKTAALLRIRGSGRLEAPKKARDCAAESVREVLEEVAKSPILRAAFLAAVALVVESPAFASRLEEWRAKRGTTPRRTSTKVDDDETLPGHGG